MVFIILILFLLLFYKIKVPQNIIGISIVILITSIIYANRSMLIPDTTQYLDMYKGVIYSNYEKGFIFLCDFFRDLYFPFSSFLFLISFIGLSIWFYITKRIINAKYLFLAFAVYTSYMGIYYHGIVLRACIAILINYIGIYYGLVRHRNNIIIFYICVIASVFFHMSAILFAPLPLIVRRKYNPKILYVTLVGSFLFLVLNNNIIFITNLLLEVMDILLLFGGERLAGYIEDVDTATLSLTHIKYFLTGIALVYLSQFVKGDFTNKDNLNIFINTYVFGIVLLFLFSFAPGSARIAQLFLFFEFLPLVLLYEGITKRKRIYMRLFLLMIIVTNMINLYRLVPAIWNYCS